MQGRKREPRTCTYRFAHVQVFPGMSGNSILSAYHSMASDVTMHFNLEQHTYVHSHVLGKGRESSIQ